MTSTLRFLLATTLALPLLFAATCRSNQEAPAQAPLEEALFLTYRVGGGMDMYEEGDRYGHGIDIRFNGGYRLYRRIYQNAEGETPSIREEEVGQGTLDEKELSSLQSKVDSLDLSSISRRLPDVDPRKVEIRSPAETALLRVRPTRSEELVEIRADMGADSQHYPPAFLRLHEHLKKLIRKRLGERDR